MILVTYFHFCKFKGFFQGHLLILYWFFIRLNVKELLEGILKKSTFRESLYGCFTFCQLWLKILYLYFRKIPKGVAIRNWLWWVFKIEAIEYLQRQFDRPRDQFRQDSSACRWLDIDNVVIYFVHGESICFLGKDIANFLVAAESCFKYYRLDLLDPSLRKYHLKLSNIKEAMTQECNLRHHNVFWEDFDELLGVEDFWYLDVTHNHVDLLSEFHEIFVFWLHSWFEFRCIEVVFS